jgi:predicted AAA+ superfamily ATPase
MVLAYNAGNETSYENISKSSGITKPTIKKYIEYLESAFLIIKLSTVADNCKSMSRDRNFKIYLNNPSMRAALFNPVDPSDSTLIGHLAESAVFSQWQHGLAFKDLRYARWRNAGEVDIVYLRSGDQKPIWAGEIKWSDQYASNPYKETRHLRYLLEKHPGMESSFFTTKTIRKRTTLADRRNQVWPTALYCYVVGKNTTSGLNMAMKYGLSRDEQNIEAA